MSTQFKDLQIPENYLAELHKQHITIPTEIQNLVIPEALKNMDLIGIAQTGTGKTLAYALPALIHLDLNPKSRLLILSPSNETALQVHKVFLSLTTNKPITTHLVVSGTPTDKQANQLNKMPRIIVATPGRLNDHLTKNKLLLKDVDMLVIDEAERMLDMGFSAQLKNIQATMRGTRQTLMFSATLGENSKTIAKLFMQNEPLIISTQNAGKPVETLKQKIYFLDSRKKKERLTKDLNSFNSKTIVFAGSKESCEEIGQFLIDCGFSADFTHGELLQGHRNRVNRDFRDGKFKILITTDMLARGLDVPDVDLIVNYDLPYEIEDFLHRIGRTARANKSGFAVTYITTADVRKYKILKKYLEGAEEVKLDPNFDFNAQKKFDREKKNPRENDQPKTRTDKYAKKSNVKPILNKRK